VKTKVLRDVIRDFTFPDDCGLNGRSVQLMQINTDGFSSACGKFDIIINTKKSKLFDLPASSSKLKHYVQP